MIDVPYLRNGRWALLLTVLAHLVLFTVIGGWLDDPSPLANDNVNLTLVYRGLLSRSLDAGGLPFWDLYSAGGMPLFSVYLAPFLNPLVIFTSLSPLAPSTALLVEVFIYSTLGVVGMWFWLGERVSTIARSLLTLAWVNSLVNVGQLHLNMEVAVSVLMMPWLMIGLTRLLDNPPLRIAVLSVAVVVIATSGYLGLGPFVFYSVVAYFAVYLVHSRIRRAGSGVSFTASPWRGRSRWLDRCSCACWRSNLSWAE
jgi:hypothetical protein